MNPPWNGKKLHRLTKKTKNAWRIVAGEWWKPGSENKAKKTSFKLKTTKKTMSHHEINRAASNAPTKV